MTEAEIREIFEVCEVLTSSHYLLTSGLHSPQYIQKFRLLSEPRYTAPLCAELAKRFADSKVELVVGPATGGIIVAYEVARHLKTPSMFVERENGALTLRRGFRIRPGARVLIVEDVVTTGGSVRETAAVVSREGGVIVGIGVLCDRSGGSAKYADHDAQEPSSVQHPPWRVEALLTLSLLAYPPESCPLCAEGVTLEEPGRTGKSKTRRAMQHPPP